MKVRLNAEKLNEILSTFYQINGIRIAIFDSEYNEIMEYPEEKCAFCKAIRKDPLLNELCHQCDIKSFEKCHNRKDIYIYKCHAGLVEAVMPLTYDNKIVGYIMLGQITDIKNKETLKEHISIFNKEYNLNCDMSGIKFRSKKQITAAARILEICAEYIILKEMITPKNDRIIAEAKAYIQENLSAQITVEEICDNCNCSRSKLYEMFRAECGIGVAHYITEKRMELAKKLLKSTELSITEISGKCGFCDYNYFLRAYKKHYGVSPKRERKNSMI